MARALTIIQNRELKRICLTIVAFSALLLLTEGCTGATEPTESYEQRKSTYVPRDIQVGEQTGKDADDILVTLVNDAVVCETVHITGAGGLTLPYTGSQYMPEQIRYHSLGTGMPVIIAPDGFGCSEGDVRIYRELAGKVSEYIFTVSPLSLLEKRFDVFCLPVSDELDMGVEVKGGICTLDSRHARIVAESALLQVATEGDGAVFGNRTKGCVLVVLSRQGDSRNRGVTYMNREGFAVSVIPVGTQPDQKDIERAVHHEVCGHAVGFLADEYDDDDLTGNSIFTQTELLEEYHAVGMHINIDTHSDPLETSWRDFVGMEEYADEKIGAYEGADGSYSKGIYRPTENSLMRDTYRLSEFNAPCRWFIYKRVMENTGGKADFKEFVQKDLQERQE